MTTHERPLEGKIRFSTPNPWDDPLFRSAIRGDDRAKRRAEMQATIDLDEARRGGTFREAPDPVAAAETRAPATLPPAVETQIRVLVARAARRHPRAKAAFDDLVQEATIGALEALPRVDPARGDPVPFLMMRARGALMDALRRDGGALGVSGASSAIRNGGLPECLTNPVPLGARYPDGALVVDPAHPRGGEELEAVEARDELEAALAGRSPRERVVLLAGSLADGARAIGVSESRACQIKNAALARLREVAGTSAPSKPGPAYKCKVCGAGATSMTALLEHHKAAHARPEHPEIVAARAKVDALFLEPKTVIVADFNDEPEVVPVAREPIQADTPTPAPACPIGEPAAPTVAAEEGETVTATATAPVATPKKAKAKKVAPKPKPGPRLCGCARTGSHKATCALAPKQVAGPVRCACGREFATASAINGHKRSCNGKPGARGAAAAKRILKLAPPPPPALPPRVVVEATPPPTPDAPVDFTALGQEIGSLVAKKQLAYGDSFGRSGAVLRILYPLGIAPAQFDDALAVVRVVDKLFRIATDRDAFGESPWRDCAGYSLLAAARVERERVATAAAKTEART